MVMVRDKKPARHFRWLYPSGSSNANGEQDHQPIPVLAPADVQHAISLIQAVYAPSAATDLRSLFLVPSALFDDAAHPPVTPVDWGFVVSILANANAQLLGARKDRAGRSLAGCQNNLVSAPSLWRHAGFCVFFRVIPHDPPPPSESKRCVWGCEPKSSQPWQTDQGSLQSPGAMSFQVNAIMRADSLMYGVAETVPGLDEGRLRELARVVQLCFIPIRGELRKIWAIRPRGSKFGQNGKFSIRAFGTANGCSEGVEPPPSGYV
ncbi:hypothetical protein C8R47DRAFT_1196860 [Mycena vitilis]|nr:hypothetical protein C8R47DRAFT_1196860 [Mycena vitilis]